MMAATPAPLLTRRTVGEVAASLPGATAIFRRHGIDTCYRTEIPLADAAASRGLDLAPIEEELVRLAEREASEPAPAETSALIDHIVLRYHAAHRVELPELVKLARRVETVHAQHPMVPDGLGDLLHQLLGELETHMKREELELFPALRGGTTTTVSGPVAEVVGTLRAAHEEHEEDLARIDVLTGGLNPPEEACRSWQALYLGTLTLVRDLGEHMRLENEVLFPRFENGGGQAI